LRKPLLYLLLGIFIIPLAAAQELPERTLHAILKPTVQLPDSNIVADSESLLVAEQLLVHGTDYVLDYLTGELSLLNGELPGREALISYQIFPVWIPRRVGGLKPEELQFVHPDSLEFVTPVSQPPPETGAANLNYQGSFLRGIRIGNQSGVDLESGLRLKVDGRIGRDIEVAAFLTDQVSPLQPEGNTQNLEEIDRIYVEVSSPDFKVTMGNFYLEYGGMPLLNYSRRIEGAQGSWYTGPVQADAAVALSRGRFNSVTLTGQDGVQGPYQLPDETGNAGILVIAGSEQIWLDGIPLTRGLQQDYIIDYSTGEITFSNRHVITSDSRITVDYEFAAEQYRRNIYLGQVASEYYPGQRLQLRYVEERDDWRNPLGWVRTDDTDQLLEQAGDDPAGLQISGVQEVEPGYGSYRLLDAQQGQWGEYAARPDPFSTDSVYRYDIVFTRLGRDAQGQLLGDYNRTYNNWGYTTYLFVGEQQGEWAPVRLITAPAGQRVIGLQLDNDLGELVSFSNTVVMSDYDRNIRSAIDDDDNLGLTSNSELALHLPHNLPWLGKPSLITHLRLRDSRYRALDRDQETEYNRNWALPTAAETVWQELESALRFQRDSRNYTRFTLGRVLTMSDREALRYSGDGVYQDSLGDGLQLHYQVSTTGADRLQQASGKSSWRWGVTQLIAELGQEHVRNSWRETAFIEPHLGVGFPLLGQRLELSARQRQLWGSDSSGGDPGFRSREYRLNLEPEHKSRLLISGGITHFEKEWNTPDSASVSTDLGQLHFVYAGSPGGLRLDGDYRIDRSLISRQVTVYAPVDSGMTGNYSEDPPGSGHFVPDPYGEYTAFTHATGDFLPTRGVQFSLRVSDTFPRGVRFSSRLQVEGRSTTDNPLPFYLLLPSELDSDSSRLMQITATQQLRIPLFSDTQNLRLTWDESRRLDRLHVVEENRRRESRIGLEHDWRLARSVTLQEEGGYKSLQTSEGTYSSDLRNWRVGSSVEWRCLRSLTLRFGYLHRQGVSDSELRAGSHGLTPGLTWRFMERGRLNASSNWTHAWANRSTVPLELLDGSRVGQNLTATLTTDYRIGRATHITGRINYRRLPGRPTNYTFSMQWQSFF